MAGNGWSKVFLVTWLALIAAGCHTRRITTISRKTGKNLDPSTSHSNFPYSSKSPLGGSPSGGSQSAYNEDVFTYVKLYSPVAVREMKQYGVPASIIIAQGLHESRAGKSVLASVANNHFGIKCTADWSGPSFRVNDDLPDECFRKYRDPESSFSDHMLFLQRKRYQPLFSYHNNDYKSWAFGLKRCGYATNPKYAEILISLIERYNLDRFDLGSDEMLPPPPKTIATIPQSSPEVRDGKQTEVLVSRAPDKKTIIITDTIHRKVYVSDTLYENAYQKAMLEAHSARGYKQYTVVQGDTFFSICKRFGANMEELKALNRLVDYGVKIGQVLVLPVR